MKNKIGYLVLYAFLINFSQAAISRAADKAEQLPALEISASRLGQSADDYPGSVTVITEKEIKKSGNVHVQDILRNQVGLNIARSGTIGATTSVFTRGANSDSTLVMIDGVQVNANTLGSYDFNNLIVNNIERIEILRGPQSTVWGADAVGGVINIVTKRGKGEPSHALSFEGGSFDTFRESVSSSGALNKADYSLSLSRVDVGGYSSLSKLQHQPVTNDGHEDTALSGRMGYNFLDDGRVELIGRYSKSSVDIDDFGADSQMRQSLEDSFNISMPMQKSINPWWDVKLNPSISYNRVVDQQVTKTDRILNRNYTLDLQNNLDLGKYFSAVFGMEYQILNGHNVLNNFKNDTYTQGYFLQTRMDYGGRLVLTGGFRHDVNSVFEDATTYKFEGSYRFRESGTRLRGVYATGFKAPTFNQLYFPNFGTPGLKPEESDSWEIGVDQSLLDNHVNIGITYFNMDFENLIQTVDLGGFIFRAQNVGKASTQGIETSITVKLPYHSDLLVNHTWLEAIDSAGTPLARRAKHNFSASLSHDWSDNLNSLLGVRIKSGVRSNNTGTQMLDAFTVWHATVNYKFNKNLKLTARGENLFDEDYQEVFGFSTPGVSGYAGFEYNF